MSRIIIALLLILIPAVMQAQDLYQLPANEYSAGIGLAFAENSTTISCAFEYGILPALEGSLGAGLEFAQESDPEISVPPAPIFAVKISSTKPLGRTGLRYLTATSFTVEFAKIIHEYTDEEVKVRGMYLSVGLGITKPINLESSFTLAPFVAIANTNAWVILEAPGFKKKDSDNAFSGQIGLDVGVSPDVDLIGSIIFSFEESDMAYSIYLSFH